MISARSHAAAVLLLGATALGQQATRTDAADIRLAIELGARNPGNIAIERLFDVLPRARKLLADSGAPRAVTDFVGSLNAEHLPATLRVFVPARFDKRRDPPYFVAVLDTARPAPVQRLLGAVAAAPGGSGKPRLFVREHDAAWGKRYLIGEGAERLGGTLKSLASGRLPTIPANRRRFLEKVAGSPIYGLLDAAALAPERDLGKLRAAGGPLAGLFALGVTRSEGDWNIDVHWGGRPGQGLLGSFLPRRAPRTSRLHELLPWEPALAVQGNLGAGVARKIARLPIPLRGPDKSLKKVLDKALAGWTGEIGVFQPAPNGEEEMPDFAPALMTVSRQYAILLRMNPDHAGELVATLANALGRGTARRDAKTGAFRLDERNQSIHMGHREGIVAICAGPDADTAARSLGTILANADRPPARPASKLEPELKGPVQLWISPAAGERLANRVLRASRKLHRRRKSSGFQMGRDLGRRMIRTGYGMSLHWDADSIRVRLRF